MVGSKEGILGMRRDAVMYKFKTQLPARFQVDEGKWQFHAVCVDMDEDTEEPGRYRKSACTKTNGGWIKKAESV